MSSDPTVNAALDPNSAEAQAARLTPFAYNPAYATPAQKEYLRRMALTLQKPGEAKSWAQVFGNMAQTAVGAMLANRANTIEELQGQQKANPALTGAGNTDQGAPAPAPDTEARPGAANGVLGYAGSDSGGLPIGESGAVPKAGGTAAGLVSSYANDMGRPGAAGLTGNFQAESGPNLNTNAAGDRDAKGNPTAFGRAQWRKERQDNLRAYAAKYGLAPNDPQLQTMFPKVEMGLAGDKSDPGFGTEARAGQALINARNPREAVAAGLMYLRPAGYSRAHPENSADYGKRLAYVTALMGGQGAPGGPNSAGGPAPSAAMPYADGGPQNPTGAPWPAEKPQERVSMGSQPQMAGGASALAPAPGPVMAQNMQPGTQVVRGAAPAQGSAPFTNLTPAQLGWWLSNQGVSDELRNKVLESNMPRLQQGAGEQVYRVAPARTAPPQPVSTGIAPANAGTPDAHYGGPVPITPAGPPASGSNGDPRAALPGVAATGRDLAAQSAAQRQQREIMFPYAAAVQPAQLALTQLDVLDKISEAVGNPGIWDKVKDEIRDRAWFNFGGLEPIDAYRAAARGLVGNLPPAMKGGFDPEAIGKIATSEAARKQISENLRTAFRTTIEQGKVANEFILSGGTDPSHFRKFNDIKPSMPDWKLSQPGAQPGGAPAPGGAQAAEGGAGSLPAPKTPEEYAAIKKGVRYQHPDDPPGHYRTKK